jgi:predicted lipid-binding transport protein (Tim44 family)
MGRREFRADKANRGANRRAHPPRATEGAMTTPRTPRKARRKHGTADADRFHAMMGAARTRRVNETIRRIKEARRTHLPAAFYATNETYEAMFLADVRAILEDVL